MSQLASDDRSAALSLLSAAAVRERAHGMLDLGIAGALAHFTLDMAKLAPTAEFVATVVRENYPTLAVPLHARWRHFTAAGRDLWAETAASRAWRSPAERARAEFDLAVVSVLLDAGAGRLWRYRDRTGITATRSEGLALASLRMFESGLFSADPRDPLRADAERLVALTTAELSAGFQVGSDNPLAGLDGRGALLARLGRAMLASPAAFARADRARPGGLFDLIVSQHPDGRVLAPDILAILLQHLGPIWSGRLDIAGVPLGDTWRHRAIRRADATDGLVPLHKLSQWLAYSLIEPLRRAGVGVSGAGLTGLAEYRNGGLFIDCGVLTGRDPALAAHPLPVDAEPVVEWRALTVALLDRVAPLVRDALGVSEDRLPLGAVLEGGTWAAGRKIARLKRKDGSPPLTVISDGTVF